MTSLPVPIESTARSARPDVPEALVTWTEWLVKTFRLEGTIRPCWPDHPAAVEELRALWLYRVGAEAAAILPAPAEGEPPPTDELGKLGLRATSSLVVWLEALDRSTDRIRRTMDTCRADCHEGVDPPAWQTRI